MSACPLFFFFLLWVGAVSAWAAPPHAAPSMRGFSDAMTYRVMINEEELGRLTSRWTPDGTFFSQSRISLAGQTVTGTVKVLPDAEGRWSSIELVGSLGAQTVTRAGSSAVVTDLEGKESTVALKPGTVLFSGDPALLSMALTLYDDEAGGRQSWPVYLLPKVVMEGSLERVAPSTHGVGPVLPEGIDEYVAEVPGVSLHLWADAEHRVLRMAIPAQHLVYVRKGHEGLAEEAPSRDRARVSQPTHDIEVMEGLRIPMRDGVRLVADVYRPTGEEPAPAILIRTPYGRRMMELRGRYFARRGYACVIQDCRGRFESEGVWEPFFNEPRDGYDTVEWIAAQDWTTGKVGMIGASYLGWVQWWAARESPPHLEALIPNVAPPDPFFNIPYEYGAFFLTGALWWADVLESEATADLSGRLLHKLDKKMKKYPSTLLHLPLVDLDEKILGKRNPYWRAWLAHPDNDSYWKRASFLGKLAKARLPVFHQSGWFDGDGIGTKLNYRAMRAHEHPNQKLVLGPWEHTDRATRRIGERDFGPTAIVDLQTEYLRWFDRWLKDRKNGIDEEPLVSLFVMGANEWIHGPSYPLPQTTMTPLYLTSQGHANTSTGDGGLSWTQALEGQRAPDSYIYDPADPTPDPSFYAGPDEAPEGESAEPSSVEEERERARMWYAHTTEARQDILVYETGPMEKAVTFAGPVEGILYAASSARDTDWFMRLCLVEPDGEVFPLVEGKIRARHRRSTEEPELLDPGRTYRYDIDMWQTGLRVEPGQRLRVEVASASFPSFGRNLNTGGHNEVETTFVAARQTVYHDPERPSHVLLPVLER